MLDEKFLRERMESFLNSKIGTRDVFKFLTWGLVRTYRYCDNKELREGWSRKIIVKAKRAVYDYVIVVVKFLFIEYFGKEPNEDFLEKIMKEMIDTAIENEEEILKSETQ